MYDYASQSTRQPLADAGLVWDQRAILPNGAHPIGTVFNAVPGVYIFCRLGIDGRWYAVYIGETDNFARRLTQELAAHHQAVSIGRSGATHICAMVVTGGKSARLNIETDLRQKQNPPCNEQ